MSSGACTGSFANADEGTLCAELGTREIACPDGFVDGHSANVSLDPSVGEKLSGHMVTGSRSSSSDSSPGV